MTNTSAHVRERMQSLRDCIARAFPEAVVDDVEDESGIPVSSTRVRLPNKVVLSVSSDLDEPATRFMVMRLTDFMGGQLPFEQCCEDGFGVSERLDADAAFDLVGKYAGLCREVLH